MVHFEITSEKECLITAIGEFAAGETKLVDEAQAAFFKSYNGYSLAEANFPEFVKVETVTEKSAEKPIKKAAQSKDSKNVEGGE
jgi:hypothetical protein